MPVLHAKHEMAAYDPLVKVPFTDLICIDTVLESPSFGLAAAAIGMCTFCSRVGVRVENCMVCHKRVERCSLACVGVAQIPQGKR